MADNNGRVLAVRNEERIRTLEREMGQMRESVQELDRKLDQVIAELAQRRGSIMAWAAVGAVVGTALVQVGIRIIFGGA